jgi:hypothetical protein
MGFSEMTGNDEFIVEGFGLDAPVRQVRQRLLTREQLGRPDEVCLSIPFHILKVAQGHCVTQ